MNISILPIERTKFSYKDVIELIHLSFQERLRQGLLFSCSSMTVDQYIEKVRLGNVLIAVDSELDIIVGTVTVTIKHDKNGVIYGYHEYLAVHPEVKNKGIASMLFKELLILVLSQKGKYILSDTACKATSSVNWHLKNGFKIFELESYRSTNYWSYVFIKYLDPSVSKGDFALRIHYYISWLYIHLTRTVNGQDTIIGRFAKMFRSK